ncbi:MAG: hypothetical protein C5B54_06580 [Acidobacteria bacterium]|nr:MAG: hypothetical protein C5B54_06580 [Acidobacteriota bacterium]
MISAVLAAVLRSGREDFNNRFAIAKRTYQELDAQIFSNLLAECVDPFLQAIAEIRPDQVNVAANAAFDASLILIGQRLIGFHANCDSFGRNVWKQILIPGARIFADRPDRAIASIFNALCNLSGTPGARAEQWTSEVASFLPQCNHDDMFFAIALIAAWRCGLAHFRKTAIDVADRLPEKIVLQLFHANDSDGWQSVKKKLMENPWFDPAHPNQIPDHVRVVAEIGAFRGFGGPFAEPPLVKSNDEDILIRSADESWLLTADSFGSTLHKIPLAEFESGKNGEVLPKGLPDFSAKGKMTSFASSPTTLALTFEYSHRIKLLSLV